MQTESEMQFNIVMPVAKRSLPMLPTVMENVKAHIPVKEIVAIGKASLRDHILALGVTFCDEDRLIDGLTYDGLAALIAARDENARDRTGWYLQQFLKMGYARVCDDEYYLSWDADTMPLKDIAMFSAESRPIFDLKEEFHPPYFETLSRLFHSAVVKRVEKSFISEHMLFSTAIMKELLDEIEADDTLKGDRFFEKIICAIDEKYLSGSGCYKL